MRILVLHHDRLGEPREYMALAQPHVTQTLDGRAVQDHKPRLSQLIDYFQKSHLLVGYIHYHATRSNYTHKLLAISFSLQRHADKKETYRINRKYKILNGHDYINQSNNRVGSYNIIYSIYK
jgi:hypothetical protein